MIRPAVVGVVAVAATAALAVSPVNAQTPPEMPIDRTLPVKDGFDVERAYIGVAPLFTPLRNPEWLPLRRARTAGAVSDDTPMLVFSAGGETLSLVTAHMSYHHVAQGEIAGEPWMVTF